MNKRQNCYGYKVCYREQGKTTYVRYFMTYTYQQAVNAVESYIRYPPNAREDGHKLNNPTWKIIPVSRDEVIAGIWRECPF